MPIDEKQVDGIELLLGACLEGVRKLDLAPGKKKFDELNALDQRTVLFCQLVFAIDDAFKEMEHCCRYIEVTSSRPKDIAAEDHIKYHYYVFLQLTYNLREKLKLLIPTVYKVGDQWVSKTEGRRNHSVLSSFIDENLRSVTELRRAVVHEITPYRDTEIHFAKAFSILVDAGYDEYILDYEDSLRDLKLFKTHEIRKEIKKTRSIASNLCAEIHKAFVFDGKLCFPSSAQEKPRVFSTKTQPS